MKHKFKKYKLVWKTETIETGLTMRDASILKAEYNMAFGGGVEIVEDSND